MLGGASRGLLAARRGGGRGGSERQARAAVPLCGPLGGGDRALVTYRRWAHTVCTEAPIPRRPPAGDLRAAGFFGPLGRAGAEPRREPDALSLETSVFPTLRAACGRANG